MITNVVPPRSPFGLIQEDTFPNEWLVLVTCIMLNRTSRKQVEKVLPEFIKRWPCASEFIAADPDDVVELCRPLGFANKRTENLFKMTKRYLAGPWEHARELPGVGAYAARAWEIFFRNTLGDEPPQDHALTRYFEWRKFHER